MIALSNVKNLPEPDFINRDVDKITTDIVALYEQLSGKKLYPAQSDRVFVDVIAYREMMLRTAINEAGKQNLVAFANGVMLDYMGEFFGVVRLAGESDEQLRERIRLAPESYSTTGSRRAYIYHAMSADERVIDAQAINVDNKVQVYILTADTDVNPIPVELIAKVQLAVNDDKRRPLSDCVSTHPAVSHHYQLDIELVVYRETNQPQVEALVKEQLTELIASLKNKLGQSVIPSKLIQTIQHPSIQQIVIKEPTQLVDIKAFEYALCGEVMINFTEVNNV